VGAKFLAAARRVSGGSSGRPQRMRVEVAGRRRAGGTFAEVRVQGTKYGARGTDYEVLGTEYGVLGVMEG
jgi:hypothetical protein